MHQKMTLRVHLLGQKCEEKQNEKRKREAHYSVKETYYNVKRDLLQCQKRPTLKKRKREARCLVV